MPARFIPHVDADDCIRNEGAYRDEVLVPGVYCGGFSLSGTVLLEAGVYIIYGTNSGKRHMNVAGDANVGATGPVTIIFTGRGIKTIGGVRRIHEGAAIRLSAPDSAGHADGEYAGRYGGMLFIQDPEAKPSYTHVFNGDGDMRLSGAIYFPAAKISFRGGSEAAPGCLQIVARAITFSGDTSLANRPDACGHLGVAEIPRLGARLTE